MNVFRALSDSWKRRRPVLPPKLPSELHELVVARRTGPLLDWLKSLPKNRSESDELHLLLDDARACGWCSLDVAKLEASGHYLAGRMDESLRASIKYAESSEGFDADMFVIAANSLYNLRRIDDASRLLNWVRDNEASLAGRADFRQIAALICWAVGDAVETHRHIAAARQLAPNDVGIALNALTMFQELGDLDAFTELEAEFQRGAFQEIPGGFSIAIVELAHDRYEEGFRSLESRYQMADAHRYLNRALFSFPRWTGQSLRGKTLLISAEQGLGDTIQMIRYLPMINFLGVENVVLETQPAALSLLQHNFPECEFVERKYGDVPTVAFDYWVGMMSLPHLLGSTVDSIPGRAGYLTVPSENRNYWHDRISHLAPSARPRIGLAWSGEPTHGADRRRSIPFELVAEIIGCSDVQYFAVQTKVPTIHPQHLTDLSEELITLADTAALISGMDLVITVDTSVVHLAGALGKETWLLLPYRYEWRWGLDGESNHWYDSVRVLRQQRSGDWRGLLDRVFGDLLQSRFS